MSQLLRLKGIGANSAWLYVMEFFGWRDFHNRREISALAGLTPTPFQSGAEDHEQGISKAGNSLIRAMAIEIAWGWLRHQPDSALSQWCQERFGTGSTRLHKIGIVALARKLLIALWHYLESGELPRGRSPQAGRRLNQQLGPAAEAWPPASGVSVPFRPPGFLKGNRPLDGAAHQETVVPGRTQYQVSGPANPRPARIEGGSEHAVCSTPRAPPDIEAQVASGRPPHGFGAVCRIHRCSAKRPHRGRSALCAYHQGLDKSANIEGSKRKTVVVQEDGPQSEHGAVGARLSSVVATQSCGCAAGGQQERRAPSR